MAYIGWGGLFIGIGLFVGFGVLANSLSEISTSIDNFNEHYERWVDAQMPPKPDEFDIAVEDVLDEAAADTSTERKMTPELARKIADNQGFYDPREADDYAAKLLSDTSTERKDGK